MALRIDILTLFPDYFSSPFSVSLIKRAIEKNLIDIRTHNLRQYCLDKHQTADDVSYGGGAGMVLKPEPMARAIRQIIKKRKTTVIYLSPQGQVFNHAWAMELSRRRSMFLICGHYEGIDERIVDKYVDEEISLGDFVMTGGEPAAAAIVDAVVRLRPGVVQSVESIEKDSFYDGGLDYPHYTKPRQFEKMDVPSVLLSGNHLQIQQWRRKAALKKTQSRRPDLFQKMMLSDEDRKLLSE
jgi:tRNA (guanine37-N1)-methyltransferase